MRTTMKLFKLTDTTAPSVRCVILVCSLVCFLCRYHAASGNRCHHLDFQMLKPASGWDHDEHGFYPPSRSAGWNKNQRQPSPMYASIVGVHSRSLVFTVVRFLR